MDISRTPTRTPPATPSSTRSPTITATPSSTPSTSRPSVIMDLALNRLNQPLVIIFATPEWKVAHSEYHTVTIAESYSVPAADNFIYNLGAMVESNIHDVISTYFYFPANGIITVENLDYSQISSSYLERVQLDDGQCYFRIGELYTAIRFDVYCTLEKISVTEFLNRESSRSRGIIEDTYAQAGSEYIPYIKGVLQATVLEGQVPTPTPSSTRSLSPTPTPTSTVSGTPSDTPTQTPTPTETPSNTGTTTNTASETSTKTPSPTTTSTPSPTPTQTYTDTPTQTPTPTSTTSSSKTQTPTGTGTETPTASETPSNTTTPSETSTNTPTGTSTYTPSYSPSKTPTPTPTSTVSTTDSNTPSPTPSVTRLSFLLETLSQFSTGDTLSIILSNSDWVTEREYYYRTYYQSYSIDNNYQVSVNRDVVNNNQGLESSALIYDLIKNFYYLPANGVNPFNFSLPTNSSRALEGFNMDDSLLDLKVSEDGLYEWLEPREGHLSIKFNMALQEEYGYYRLSNISTELLETIIPTPTPTNTQTTTSTSSQSSTRTPSNTASSTRTASRTMTSTSSLTASPTPSNSNTPSSTETPTPSTTNTLTASPTPTSTSTPSNTSTITETPTTTSTLSASPT